MTVVFLIVGLLLLILGAELLVRGAAGLARSLGVSPLVTGLTVVAFATSSPELAIGVQATLSGESGIVLGNVIGSNIANVLLILGLSASVAPLAVARRVIWIDVPVMIGVAVVLLLLSLDGSLGRLEGVLFVAALVLHTVWLARESRRGITRQQARDEEVLIESEAGHRSAVANVALVAGGLGLLVLGSNWLVDSAVTLARLLGVSDLVVGLTVVAVGTSLPELTTSVVATIRGERDIAVGNVVGSNTWNILFVLGISALVSPQPLILPASARSFDLPVMVVVSLACLPIFFRGHVIARWEGGLLLGYYVAYIAYLLLSTTAHPALQNFSNVMLWFAIPLTLVTIVVLAARYSRGQTPSGAPSD